MAKPPWGPNNLEPAWAVIRRETERITADAKARGRVVVSDRLHDDRVYLITALPDGTDRETFTIRLPSNARSEP